MDAPADPPVLPPLPRRWVKPVLLTLLALLVLGVVIFVGFGLGMMVSQSGLNEGRATAAQSDFSSIKNQVMVFQARSGRLPTQAEGLSALINRPASLAPEIPWQQSMAQVPLDPWGNAYLYEIAPDLASGYRLHSLGKNASDPNDDLYYPAPPPPPVPAAPTQTPP